MSMASPRAWHSAFYVAIKFKNILYVTLIKDGKSFWLCSNKHPELSDSKGLEARAFGQLSSGLFPV